MLLALTTVQRCQTLQALDINNMKITQDSVVFTFNKLLKHEKPGRQRLPLRIETSADTDLCAVRTLKEYIKYTSSLRGTETQLFISFKKPHRSVCTDTVRRWLLVTMNNAGINTSEFKSHSTRSAAASAALRNDVPIDKILEAGQWKSRNILNTYYNKPVVK